MSEQPDHPDPHDGPMTFALTDYDPDGWRVCPDCGGDKAPVVERPATMDFTHEVGGKEVLGESVELPVGTLALCPRCGRFLYEYRKAGELAAASMPGARLGTDGEDVPLTITITKENP